ncbi:orotate phosphoribosyltransferase [Deltaproteobacteria bacterium]|nr:orotate phosphoribosyltransferase [Deltaproteobacteria bacterium]
MRTRLVELLREKSYRRRRVILASGRESDFYVDARQTTLHAEGAWIIGSLIHQALDTSVVGIGGLTMGADPIASAVATFSWSAGRPVHAFIVRKEPKGHGTQTWVEGLANLPPGSPVAIVEDTCTTGGSLLRAVDRAEADGLRVVQCFTVVDREEGAEAALAARGFTLHTLVRRSELESE